VSANETIRMSSKQPALVVFSSLFPNRAQPHSGLFIRERMFRVAKFLPLTVVAPVPWFPLQGVLRAFRPHFRLPVPRRELQDGIDVLHPRYFSVPGALKRLDGFFLALGAYRTLARLRRAGRLDVLDAHFAYPDGYAATLLGRWLGVPVTITLRGTEPRHLRTAGIASRARRALHGAARLFAVSSSLKQVALGEGVPAERITVVANGVDAEKFASIPKEEARAKLGIPPRAKVLVTVGGLVERKGFHRVMDAMRALGTPELHYLAVGGPSVEGDWSERLRRRAAELGLAERVHFLGAMAPEALKTPLSAADVFVLATANEGWANVFLEAMACGLPVVATDVGGNREVVASPALGTVVPFGDHAALVDALRDALGRAWDRERIVAHARANNWESRVQVLEAEFKRLAAPGKCKASLYTALVSRALFPAHERLKGHTSAPVRRALEASQWWPRERLEAVRLERLRTLLGNAGAHVPYYRDLFRHTGFDPRAVRSLSDLAALPFLTKADIRANSDALKSARASGLARFNTGGSSGEPLVFFIGKERVSHDVAAKWRATRWWGVDIGDPEIVVWGSPIELQTQDRLRALRDALLRTELLPAFEMSEKKLDRFLGRIRVRRPRMLFGYPSALAYIASHAERRGVDMTDIGIAVAFVTSERLYPHQRETIERAFACRVANGYGGRDAGFIAHECPAGSLHITAEDLVVETVDGDGRPTGPGTPGEIVVTHLATGDYPFIRYRTGDIGVLDDKPCACGRTLPVLREVQGRTTDFVVAEDGTVMHGLALIYILRDLAGLRSFKIVQESRSRIRVLLVPEPGFDLRLLDEIKAGFRARLGPQVEVHTELLPELQAERSGKFRYVVSHVAAA
jgi:phenylacetate-CoA ligase